VSHALYDEDYARRYREHDNALDDCRPYEELVAWLRDISTRMPPGFGALDLGCGTGRYFWALRGVGELTGLDESAPMLEQAATPVHADRIAAVQVSLVKGDLAQHEFPAASFDLVYSIGVLAEHVALDGAIVARVARWLRPGGRFAFTTVHPESPSVPQTPLRRVARGVAQLVPASLDAPLRERLLAKGLYADERRVRELVTPSFAIETLERFESEAHLHCRCVARKPA
jgi:SAM-dependent methyltransferase